MNEKGDIRAELSAKHRDLMARLELSPGATFDGHWDSLLGLLDECGPKLDDLQRARPAGAR